MNGCVSFKNIFREKELWLLILIGILYFYRPLFMGETFYFRDLGLYTLPQKRLLVEFIQNKEWPLWDVYMHGGQPYLASINLFALYPFNLLYFFFPLFRAFNLTIVFHLLLCPVCAYLFARILRLPPISSFIAGIVYGFCGYILSLVNLVVLFLAMAYLPLLLMFWHLFLLERKRKWFVIAVLVGVLRVLAGAPESNVMGMLMLLGWSLCYPYPSSSFLRKIGYWGLLGVFTLGLSSVQLFPTIEMMFQSSRGAGFDYSAFTQWSLHPVRTLEFLFPQLLGHVNTILWDVYYWGGNLVDGRTPYILSIYFGSVAIALAIVGGVYRGEDRAFPFKIRLFLLLLISFSIIFSWGRHLPFFYVLYKYIPLITIFRYPVKFPMAALLPIALLAGYGSAILFGNTFSAEGEHLEASPITQKTSLSTAFGSSLHSWFLSSKILIVMWSLSVVFLLFLLTFWFSKDFAAYVQDLLFKRDGGDIAYRGMLTSFAHAFGAWLVFLLLCQYHVLKKQSWQHWALAGLLVVDMLLAGSRVSHFAPKDFFTDIPPIAQTIQNEIGEGRLFRSPDPEDYSINIPSYDLVWLHRWDYETVKSYFAVFYQIPVIFHGDPDGMASKRIMRLKYQIDSLPWERRHPLLSAGGVTVVVTADALSVPGLQLLAELPNRSNVPFYLYRNETAAARTEFVTSWEIANTDTEALEAMLRPDYDPRYHVILETPESPKKQFPLTIPSDSSLQPCDNVRLKKIRANSHSAQFVVTNACDGYLVFADPFYPGWHASVDGESTPIWRANLAFSAIFLSAGEHTIERCYRPDSLRYGMISSLTFCVIFAGIMCKKRWFE